MRKGLVLGKHSGFRSLHRASAVESPVDRSASSHQLQAILSNMALALNCVDEAIVWTDGSGRIQWCNAPFEQLVNRSPLLEQPLTELLPLTLNGALLPLHPASMTTGQRCEGQYDFQRPDRRFTLAITVKPLPIATVEASLKTSLGAGLETDPAVTNGVMLVIRDVTASLQPQQAEIACHDEQTVSPDLCDNGCGHGDYVA